MPLWKPLLITSIIFSQGTTALGQFEVGNGGDAVECEVQAGSPFSGIYSLDYLVTYRSSNRNADISNPASLLDSLNRIHQNFVRKVPEFADTMAEFIETVRNTDDYTLSRIWEEAPFGLVDLTDENIVGLTPANCRDGDRVRIVQAVVRQPHGSSGLPAGKILYRYVPTVFDDLATNSPLQLSFLLVHEWLWDHSLNVDRNRRVNRYLHSDAFFNGTTEQVRAQLRALGMVIGPTNPDASGRSLQVGHEGACFLWKRQLTCWGRHSSVSNYNPRNPYLVAVGSYHACFADDEGVKCTPSLSNTPLLPPMMRNVTSLAAGNGFSCAVHRDGVSCWGSGYDQEPSPNVSLSFAATTVVAKGSRACAFGEGKFHCWSRSTFSDPPVSPWPAAPHQYGRVRRVELGYKHLCIEDEAGLKCSGENEFRQSQPPILNGLRDFSLGYDHSCAIDRDGLTCWGRMAEYAGAPLLTNPSLVSSAHGVNCAVDDVGVKCWGSDNSDGQLNVPEHLRQLPRN